MRSVAAASSLSPGVLGGLAFALGYLTAYFLSTAIPTPLLWYYPLQHRFQWQVHPTGLAADFYGRVLLSLASGAATWLLSHVLGKRFVALSRSTVVHGLLVWVAGLLLFTSGLYVSLLVHREPLPVPLPSGYVFR